ncbi:hypothetical protein QEN19_003145 [Hanseniaspora menglaensis]
MPQISIIEKENINLDSNDDLAVTSLGFSTDNILLYRFINFYQRGINYTDTSDGIFDYKEIFEKQIPKRLFVDIPEFLNQASANKLRSHLSDFPVFKKLKMRSLTSENKEIIDLLPILQEKYLRYTKYKTHFKFPRSTFDRFLTVLLNPIDQVSDVDQYKRTLQKLFIPLEVASYYIEFEYDSSACEILNEKKLFIQYNNSQNKTIQMNDNKVQAKLQPWLKHNDNKEVLIFVNDLRKIMATTFGYDLPTEDKTVSEKRNGETVKDSENDTIGVLENMKRLGNKMMHAYTEFAKIQEADYYDDDEEDAEKKEDFADEDDEDDLEYDLSLATKEYDERTDSDSSSAEDS